MTTHKDQLNRTIRLLNAPKRIISLVPSQTELLYDLGLEEEVIGITKFCVHPEAWFRNKKRIGGTKTVNIATIASLQPDLIIANKEENVKEQIEALEKIAPVWVSDINTLADALQMIEMIGNLTSTTQKAGDITTQIRKQFSELAAHIVQSQMAPRRTAYMIWKDPYMVAGADTFISDLLRLCGWQNVFAGINRYPEVTIEDLRKQEIDLLLLSSEPYPFKEKHIAGLQQELPGTQIMLVDGEMFSWYGSRLLHTAAYVKGLYFI